MMRAFCRTSSRALRSSRSREMTAAMVSPIANISRNTRLNLMISFMRFPPYALPLFLPRSFLPHLVVFPVLLREEDRVPLRVCREVRDQPAAELGVLRAVLEAFRQALPDRK